MKIPTRLSKVANYFIRSPRLYNSRVKLASAVLYKKSQKCKTATEYVTFVNNVFHDIPLRYIGWSITPSQVNKEIETLLTLLSKENIKSMLEIGTFNGGTLFLFTRIINPNAKIISLDMPGGEFGGGYTVSKMKYLTNFPQKNQRIFLIRSDSHSAASLVKTKSILKRQQLDFLFIDGDHTYEGVKKDFQMYSRLVRKGGLVAFHDICKHPPETKCDVYTFWNEIKQSYPHKEIINDSNQNWAGIGVLYF
jgi:predicted O-methyltransferase YrrM